MVFKLPKNDTVKFPQKIIFRKIINFLCLQPIAKKVRSLHYTSLKQNVYTPKRHTTAVKFRTFTKIVILWSIVTLLHKYLVDQTPTSNFCKFADIYFPYIYRKSISLNKF